MSEKIYRWLLRLYPSEFRETYGDEALRLIRDRARDEKGILSCLRLWLDLLADLAFSVPREHFYAQSRAIGASALYNVYGLPVFCPLESETPNLGALFSGGVISIVALSIFWVLLGYGGSPRMPVITTGGGQGDFRLSQEENSNAESQAAADVTSPANTEQFRLDTVERQRVVAAAVAILRADYIDRENGRKMADALTIHEKSGDYNAVTSGEAFASLLTRQMREISPDRHLALVYSHDAFPPAPREPTPEELASYAERMKQQNCGFEKVETLPHNIGYLKLNSFADLSVCRATAAGAMASVNHADAIIYDLRDNRGGEPAMVAFMAAYLFDHPEYWYNPRENTTEQSWTRSPVSGNRLADKPVYVLTSPSTFSGAEQFCYDLKMLKRATLVGETTGGAAHSGVWHRIDDHFGMGVPETKPLNPFSQFDWAEVGVQPDVKVKAADALQVAVKIAQDRTQR
jgi:Peptidase family S41/N-terminal domain of Peptidase_S41 in eukaryotic IRBP